MSRLLLIHPATGTSGWGETESWGMPPLALGYVAALTPAGWDIKIADEYVEQVSLDEPADLVGITAYSVNAPRAYELATQFRERGTPVVLGGIHVSMLPEEASNYADAVVVGEAESIWQEVISVFEHGKLKPVYHAERSALANLPIPRRDLFSTKYVMDVIQTTRGCPFGCRFCSVTAFNGAEYRQRPVNDVLDELETIDKKVVYFVDDNILGFGEQAEQRALELFRGMVARGLKKIWVTQASINIADHPEVLRAAYRAGCRFIFVGIESVALESLREMKKAVNLRKRGNGVTEAVREIQKHGIGVIGAFVVGNDNDDLTIFQRTLDSINEMQLDVFQLSFITPFPGTKLHDDLQREGRVIYDDFPSDWKRCDMDQVMLRPKNMTIDQLIRGYDYIIRGRITTPKIVGQFFRTLVNTRSLMTAILGYNFNRDFQKYVVPDPKFKRAR